jgi:hypothetical protein
MKIFWDIDETLIHSRTYESKLYKHNIHFRLDCGEEFFTCVRPCSKALIQYSRALVGEENVHILTAASFDYAREISRLAEWGFTDENIFSRETMEKYCIRLQSLYGVDKVVNPHPYANKNNVLIDNLMPMWNDEKTTLMGINPKTHYLKVEDYMGDNSDEDIFADIAKHFLNERHKEAGVHSEPA